MEMEDFDDLLKEALDDRDVRSAIKENCLRRRLAAAFDNARRERGLSVRELAKLVGTSSSQIQRLLHADVGGSLTLSTICRAADALGLSVSVHARPERQQIGAGALIEFGNRAWTPVFPNATALISKETVPARAATPARIASGSEVGGKWLSGDGQPPPLAVGV